MKNKYFSIIIFLILSITGISLCVKEPKLMSDTERRMLEKRPVFSMENVMSGKYTSQLESYLLDHFPGRDSLRLVKTITDKYIFVKRDTNNLFEEDGYLSKNDYPFNEKLVVGAADKFENIYHKYIEEYDITPKFVIVPDKNMFMKKSLKLDYDRLYELMEKETPDFEYIDIRDYLSLDDYYRTDSHWRQECIEDVALAVLKGMDVNVGNVVPKKVEMASDNFYGVYAGQYMLPVKPDGIFYLTDDDIMEECSVINYEMDNADRLPLYNFKALNNKDQYDIFAGGSSSVIKIYNPKAKADKKLIVFRDSFGSSIAPLFAEFYSEITMLDIRYIRSDLLGEYADFENADVLFLYSTTVINNSQGLK